MNSYLRLKFCYISSFKPPFIVPFYVNFSLSLSLFSLLLRLRTPLHTSASRGLYSTCSNYLIQYPTSFSSIDVVSDSFLCPLSNVNIPERLYPRLP